MIERLRGLIYRTMNTADVNQGDRLRIAASVRPVDAKRARVIVERGLQFIEFFIGQRDSIQRRGFALAVADNLEDGLGLTMEVESLRVFAQERVNSPYGGQRHRLPLTIVNRAPKSQGLPMLLGG